MTDMNTAYIAHIVADSPNGPRGDKKFSSKLARDFSNLMLLCDEHHRLIDREGVANHPVDRLRAMKTTHETRIEMLTSLGDDRKSHVVLYGANIGDHQAQQNKTLAFQAMQPNHYPADVLPIQLGLENSPLTDDDDFMWEVERKSLNKQFANSVKPRLSGGDAHHFSIFALAPQPLLMELGRLLSDIPTAEVYQLHREPQQDWKWKAEPVDQVYTVQRPQTRYKCVALNLSLSATITPDRIAAVLSCDHSTWTMTIDSPDNDYLKSRQQLQAFRQKFRTLLNDIKAEHGQDAEIHVFPAVPVSVAVEIGRTWVPKADLPMKIYDQNRKRGGFIHAFNIGSID